MLLVCRVIHASVCWCFSSFIHIHKHLVLFMAHLLPEKQMKTITEVYHHGKSVWQRSLGRICQKSGHEEYAENAGKRDKSDLKLLLPAREMIGAQASPGKTESCCYLPEHYVLSMLCICLWRQIVFVCMKNNTNNLSTQQIIIMISYVTFFLFYLLSCHFMLCAGDNFWYKQYRQSQWNQQTIQPIRCWCIL